MKSWIWIFVILAGSLPLGSALEYYSSGEPYRNTSTRNWLVVGQVVFGVLVMAFGLHKQFETARPVLDPGEPEEIKLNGD